MTTISYYERMGFDAERNNQNPHTHWQYAEYLKREKNDKSQRNTNKLDAKRNRQTAGDVDSGKVRQGNKPFHRGKKRAVNMDESQKTKAETSE